MRALEFTYRFVAQPNTPGGTRTSDIAAAVRRLSQKPRLQEGTAHATDLHAQHPSRAQFQTTFERFGPQRVPQASHVTLRGRCLDMTAPSQAAG